MRATVDYSRIAQALITDYGLTHEEFAQLAEVSDKTVGRWLSAGPANAKAVRRALAKLGADPAQYGVPGALAVAPPAPTFDVDALVAKLLDRLPTAPAVPVGDTETPAWAQNLAADVAAIRGTVEDIARAVRA